MKSTKVWQIGGFVAGVVLLIFGVVAIFLGVNGFTTTRDAIKDEGITFGTTDDPAVAKYAEQWAGEQVKTGDQARAFAQVMRYHTVNAEWNTEHLTYAQMGRFLAADDPSDPAGTSDEAAALKDEAGNPVSNSFRNQWVTETALSTALNMSYMAERLSVFGLVVGFALLLTGVGLVILAFAVFGRTEPVTKSARARPSTTPVTG
ncbi:MAG TPA: hypothetical protein VI409_07210 [Gaiellaceae bacterium]|nr:hypothetical protein [Gaiellaceae bacterium]